MKKIKLLLLLILLTAFTFSQIYNVEGMRRSINYDGWYVVPDFNVKIDYSDNFVFILGTKLNMYLRFKDELLLWANFINFTFANDERLINNSLSHIRHDHAFSDIFQMESFIEAQQNEVKLVDLRAMVGNGPRLRFFEKEGNYMFWAIMYAFEYEKIVDHRNVVNIHNYHNRLVTYLSFNVNFWKIKSRKLIGLNVVTYYQPKIFNRVRDTRESLRIVDYKDFRIKSDVTLAFYFHKNFSLKFTGAVNYDHKPEIGVSKVSTSFVPKLSANLKFGSRDFKNRKKQFENAMEEIQDDTPDKKRKNGSRKRRKNGTVPTDEPGKTEE